METLADLLDFADSNLYSPKGIKRKGTAYCVMKALADFADQMPTDNHQLSTINSQPSTL